ncbi:MAG: EscD/YscD/HrpQ family type III secretion system periplasmic domain-containing protein, partial [Candidatus Methylacidiphilales bacterium]
AGALLLLVTILLLLYWTQPVPQSMAPLTGTELKTLLETKIKDLQLAGLIKVQTIDPVPVSPPASGLPPVSPDSLTPAPRAAEGQVRVTGYVATDAERSALYNALAPSLGRAQFEVYSQENILSQSADILRQLSIPLRLTVEGPGIIKAEGTIVSRASWQRALVFLKRDIRGLNQVQERLVALPELIDEIKKILTDARIDNSVRVEGTIRQLTAVGTLADNRSGAWQVAKKSIIEKTTGWVQFTDQVQLLTPAAMAAATGKPEAAPASPLSLEIQGVSSTPAFVTLKNGQTYFPGALLPNGYTLVAIRENQLILNRETERISLNLSDMTWQQIPTP